MAFGNATQEFIDANQYSPKSILKYERIFGPTWVSTGGETTTKDFCLKMRLKPGYRVLDVGCGTGGSAFYMARLYGVNIEGIDLSNNMLHIADDRLQRQDRIIQNRVTFKHADVTKCDYPENTFDIIYSRDTILHIKDKEDLFQKFRTWLKPGGQILVSDYCRGDQPHSAEFIEYITGREYDLRTVTQYGKLIEDAGFQKVQALDMSNLFLEVLQAELKYFMHTKEAFIKDFSDKDYYDIVEGWTRKTVRVREGDQAWGLFIADK